MKQRPHHWVAAGTVLTVFRRAGNVFLCVWDTQAMRALVSVWLRPVTGEARLQFAAST